MSIPLKVLHDAVGLEISLEVTNGEVYHGTVAEVQDTMNVLLTKASKVTKSGKKIGMESVLVRGSNIVFFQIPDSLKLCRALVTADKLVPKSEDDRGAGNGFATRNRKKQTN